MARIHILLKHQDALAQAHHSATQTMARLALACGALKKLDDSTYQMTTSETWRALKDRLRPSGGKRPVPRLNPPSKPINLDLSYPAKGQETVIHPHRALRAACDAAKARK